MTATSTQTEAPSNSTGHPVDPLHELLVELVNRTPWHSEVQQAAMMDLARQSEQAMKGDAIDNESPPVVPPPSYVPPPVDVGAVFAGTTGAAVDYDRLAQAMVSAQSAQAAGAKAATKAETHAAAKT